MRPDQQALLAKPFLFAEHAFIRNGNSASGVVYILKSAIRNRLSQVDPAWRLSEPEFVCVDGDVVIMRGSLTVCGVTRFQIGTAIIQRADKDGVKLEGYSLAKAVAKAYKTAATDILPRAAVEYNVGTYLKDIPQSKKPTTETALKEYLDKLTAPPADPNAWSIENTRTWLNKWRASGLIDDKLKKALGITDKWSDFKGTVAEADKAVEAYRDLQSAFPVSPDDMKPAQPKAANLPRITCETMDLREGDVILQETKSQTLGTAETRLEVTRYWGKLAASQYKLEVKNLATDEIKTVIWSGGDVLLCDGPKVKAYAADKSVCKPPRFGTTPVWAAPVSV